MGEPGLMSVFNIFDMSAGEELGRYFAMTAEDALNAMARAAGFADFGAACDARPALETQVFVTEL